MKTASRSLAYVALFFVTQLALAVPPTIQHIPFDATITNDSCGFAVTAHVTGTIVDISYTDLQGIFHEFQASPQAKATLTNEVTDKSITVNVSGAEKLTVAPDGSVTVVGTGNWLFLDDPDNLGAPGWFLTSGRWLAFFDPNGVETLTRTGKKTDLCIELEP